MNVHEWFTMVHEHKARTKASKRVDMVQGRCKADQDRCWQFLFQMFVFAWLQLSSVVTCMRAITARFFVALKIDEIVSMHACMVHLSMESGRQRWPAWDWDRGLYRGVL